MKKLSIFLLLLFFTVYAGWSQVLSLSECVRLARDNYPLIAKYGILEKIEGVTLSNVAKSWLPQGSIGVLATWQNDVATLPSLLTNMLEQQGMEYPGIDKFQYRVGIDVTQKIWDGGKSNADKRNISSATEIERASLDLQLYDVEGKVQEIYFSILLVEDRIDRIARSMQLVEATLDQMESMFKNGVAMKSDRDQVEATLLGLRQQQTNLLATYKSLSTILEIFTGEKIGNRTLQLPSEDQITEAGHPQMRLFDYRINNLKIQEEGIRASVMPNIGAFASGYYGYPGYNMFKNMQTHDPSLNFMIGLKATWNFGALYTRRNSLTKLQLQRDQIDVEREVFTFNNDMAITESMNQISALRELIKSDSRIVELRHSVVESAQSQLRNGVIDATALLTKITEEEIAENDMSLHKIELIKNIYNLNHISNK